MCGLLSKGLLGGPFSISPIYIPLRIHSAYSLLEGALDIAQEFDKLSRQAHILSDFARDCLLEGNEKEAEEKTREAIAIYQHLEHASRVARANATA